VLVSAGLVGFPESPAGAAPASVDVLPIPEGVTDADAPRPLAARVSALIRSGNARGGAAALAVYRQALDDTVLYRNRGGNADFARDVFMQLGRGFFLRNDVPNARWAWRLASSMRLNDPEVPLVDRGVADAAKRRYRAAVAEVGSGFHLGMNGTEIMFFVPADNATPGGSPSAQFDRGVTQMSEGDVRGARRSLLRAASAGEFPQIELCLAVLDLADGASLEAVHALLRAGTIRTGPWTPDVRSFSSPEARHAALLLLALTER
jgi:hypothetical protein